MFTANAFLINYLRINVWNELQSESKYISMSNKLDYLI